jgi:hypothetical protein
LELRAALERVRRIAVLLFENPIRNLVRRQAVTQVPDSISQQKEDTDALQDGWVTSSKNIRKLSSPFDPEIPDSKVESKPWDILEDGWNKHK